MVDNGSTYNYFSSTKVERLGFVLKESKGIVKDVNSPIQFIIGMAKVVTSKVGLLMIQTSFSTMKMDGFTLIIITEFLRDTQMVMYLYGNTLITLGSGLCILHVTFGRSTGVNLSAIK